MATHATPTLVATAAHLMQPTMMSTGKNMGD